MSSFRNQRKTLLCHLSADSAWKMETEAALILNARILCIIFITNWNKKSGRIYPPLIPVTGFAPIANWKRHQYDSSKHDSNH
mmetsp:Transcript_9791/g.15783  ORF Transcript_9791/g.15783 Transcript_9791/m.15783 type:complete len:82 (+) Transcript_9791:44-289(+)